MAQSKQPVMINDISFDALIETDERLESEVPNFPTETGFSISDAVILKPRTLDMKLFLSNTPVTHRDKHGANPYRVQETIAKLKELYFKREPVTVTTMRGVNRNMAILSMGWTASLELGTSREISISFQEIRFAESKTSTIPESYGMGGATGVNAGTASVTSGTVGSSAAGSGSKGSVLYGMAKSAGLFG